VQGLFEEYGLTYTTGPLPKQVASAWSKVVRLSLPNGFVEEAKGRLRRRAAHPVTPSVAADDAPTDREPVLTAARS
jgi:linoleoyl-CoA desaturase